MYSDHWISRDPSDRGLYLSLSHALYSPQPWSVLHSYGFSPPFFHISGQPSRRNPTVSTPPPYQPFKLPLPLRGHGPCPLLFQHNCESYTFPDTQFLPLRSFFESVQPQKDKTRKREAEALSFLSLQCTRQWRAHVSRSETGLKGYLDEEYAAVVKVY